MLVNDKFGLIEVLVSFWSFFVDRMDNLGLIDIKLGLYIKVNVNTGQI